MDDFLMGTGFNSRVAWSPLAEGAKPKSNRSPYPPIEIAPRARARPVEPTGPTVIPGSLLDILRQALPAYWLELYEESSRPNQINLKDEAWWAQKVPVRPSFIMNQIYWVVTQRGHSFWFNVRADLVRRGL